MHIIQTELTTNAGDNEVNLMMKRARAWVRNSDPLTLLLATSRLLRQWKQIKNIN